MAKDFDGWHKAKQRIHKIEFSNYVKEREVWWCAIGVNVGVEIDGKNIDFERPVLVLKKFSKDAVLRIPLTTRRRDNPYYIPLRHDGIEFAAIISQIRLVSTKRLLRVVYRMDSRIFKVILKSVTDLLNGRLPLTREPRRTHVH